MAVAGVKKLNEIDRALRTWIKAARHVNDTGVHHLAVRACVRRDGLNIQARLAELNTQSEFTGQFSTDLEAVVLSVCLLKRRASEVQYPKPRLFVECKLCELASELKL